MVTIIMRSIAWSNGRLRSAILKTADTGSDMKLLGLGWISKSVLSCLHRRVVLRKIPGR